MFKKILDLLHNPIIREEFLGGAKTRIIAYPIYVRLADEIRQQNYRLGLGYAKGLVLFTMFFSTSQALALEDSMLKSLEISAYGNKFQAERLKVAAENLANEDSVSTNPDGDPYRRKTIYGTNTYDKKLKTRVMRIKKYGVDKRPFKMRYEPHHPGANKDGYLKLANVDKMIEKADANEAQRSYEAGLGMMEVAKQMVNKTIEAMR